MTPKTPDKKVTPDKNEKYSNIHKMWLKVLKLSHDVVREPPQDLLRYYKVRFLIEYVIPNYNLK